MSRQDTDADFHGRQGGAEGKDDRLTVCTTGICQVKSEPLQLSGPVVGRKNHYGSRSKRGTDVAALFYTLCETAKLQDVEPRTYLLKAAYAAIEQPGTVLPDVLRDDSAA